MSKQYSFSKTMKAWVCKGYGSPDVLTLENRAMPVPKDNELLIRVYATTVSSGDVRVRTLKLPKGYGFLGRLIFGFTRPRQPVLGTELSGIVEAVGRSVSTYKPGDKVVGFSGGAMGCHAHYRLMAENGLIAMKPENLSFEEAACLFFGGTTALHFLRKANLHSGDKILIIGASGAVGSAMVQIAHHMGAQVVGVTSTKNVDFVQSLGAQKVIDYQKQIFTESGETYDIIADTVAASSFAQSLPVLNENGRYLSIAGGLSDLFARKVGTKRLIGGPASGQANEIKELCRLAEAGIFKPAIESTYHFEQMVEAHARVETGHKRGNVVVTLVDNHRGN